MNTTTIDGHVAVGNAEDAELRANAAALDAEARTHWWDNDWRKAQAATITKSIYEGFAHENLLQHMATVENVQLGDRIMVEDVRGLEVFWIATGGQIDESTITDRSWEMRKDRVGYHVTELDENMESGFSRNARNLVNLAITQMDAAINKRLFGLFQAAIPGNSSPYFISAAGLSLPALDRAISEVGDETLDGQMAIIGRRTMTDQIITELEDRNGFLPVTNEQLLRGELPSYRGVPIVTLKNFRDSSGKSFIPGNELILTGRAAATVGFWGGMRGQEWSEQGGHYWHNFGYRSVGMALSKKAWVRRIVDTSRNP